MRTVYIRFMKYRASSTLETCSMWSTNKNVMRIMFYLMILISIVSLTACKEVTSEQLPPGSKVQVNPEELNWTIANNGGVSNYDPGF